MTVWRIPAADDAGDPYTYVDLGWADSLTPGAEEGVWCPAETFTHLMLIAAAADDWRERNGTDGEGELIDRLQAYAVSNRQMIFGAARYVVEHSPPAEGDWWDVVDTHDPDRRPHARRRLRQAADDEALKLNGEAS